MRSRIARLFLIGAMIGTGTANLSRAQSDAPAEQLLNQTIVLDLGVFVLGTTTKANLNGQGTDNPEIDFNHTFGTGYGTQRFRIDGLWRITERNHLEFMYFTDGTSHTRTLDQTINWGNVQYDVGASVTARTRLNIYELGYEFAFLRKPTLELAAGIGVHYTQQKLGLSGVGTVTGPGGSQTAGFESKTASVPTPLPVIALRMGWAFADHWMLDAQLQALDFSYDQFHGYWSDARLGVTYLFNKHVGVGLGYDNFTTHLNVSQSGFNGRLNVGYRGALIYLTGAF